jgi:N-methylhydantoinase B
MFGASCRVAFGFGGEAAKPAKITIQRGDEEIFMLKANALPLTKGSRVLVETGGGGGYGSVNARSPELIENDLADEYTTKAFYNL